MKREVIIYQPKSAVEAEQVTSGLIEPAKHMYQPAYQCTINQNTTDQDVIFGLRKLKNVKNLPRPYGVPDVVQINDRVYLILPTKYRRLWTWNDENVAVPS